MTNGPGVVIKVGGSLLDLPSLPRRLAGLVETLRDRGEPAVALVGGGRAADLIRAADALHRFPPRTSHALAIRAMRLSAELLAASAPGLRVVGGEAELDAAHRDHALPVVDPVAWFLATPDPRIEPGWDFTSDALSAVLAHRLNAGRLWLCKSALPDAATDLDAAARLGLVDPCTPRVAAGLEVTLVNLRADPPTRRVIATP